MPSTEVYPERSNADWHSLPENRFFRFNICNDENCC